MVSAWPLGPLGELPDHGRGTRLGTALHQSIYIYIYLFIYSFIYLYMCASNCRFGLHGPLEGMFRSPYEGHPRNRKCLSSVS